MSRKATLKKYKVEGKPLTEAQYAQMLENQHRVCAICFCHQRYQALAVDHSHKTGFVRGLLCLQCNRGLGRFFDSSLRLRRAAEYLEEAKAREVAMLDKAWVADYNGK